MSFIIQNIDLIIFSIGMFLVNYTIFFIKIDNEIILRIADYLKNFNIIDMSYLVILGLILGLILVLKLISIYMLLFSSTNKMGFQSSCFLSLITFSLFFIFSIGIQFVVYLLLSRNWIKQLNPNIKNIVFAIMSVFSVLFINIANINLSKLHPRKMGIIFIDALPLQNAKLQNTKLEN